jgi:maleamate amidohydrolase
LILFGEEPDVGTDPFASEYWTAAASELDRRVTEAAGYGAPAGLGKSPAILVVDVVYSETGEEPRPILDAIEEYRTSCGERAWQALPTIRQLIDCGRAVGAPIVYSHNRTRRSELDLARRGEKNRRAHEELDTWSGRANEIHDSVRPQDGDTVIEKQGPSPFFGTPLVARLIALGVDSVIIVGGTTSGCVRAAAVDAYSYNFRVAVVSDGVFDRWELSHDAALFDLNNRYADVLTADQTTSYLDGLRTGDAVAAPGS